MDATRHDGKSHDICRFTLEYCPNDDCIPCDKRAKSLMERLEEKLCKHFTPIDDNDCFSKITTGQIKRIFDDFRKQELL